MKRAHAEFLMDVVDYRDLKIMFINAQNTIQNWKQRSRVNPYLTKGVAWNVMAGGFSESTPDQMLSKPAIRNILIEFGDYLPKRVLDLIPEDMKKPFPEPSHQEPKKINFGD